MALQSLTTPFIPLPSYFPTPGLFLCIEWFHGTEPFWQAQGKILFQILRGGHPELVARPSVLGGLQVYRGSSQPVEEAGPPSATKVRDWWTQALEWHCPVLTGYLHNMLAQRVSECPRAWLTWCCPDLLLQTETDPFSDKASKQMGLIK